MCETNQHWRLWTLPDTGLCTNQVGYDDPTLSMSQISSIDEQCIYLIRCALSQGFERDCICNHLNCSQFMINHCPSDLIYPFPSKALIRPYMFSLYSLNRTWLDRTPDSYMFEGEILCRGYYGVIFGNESKGLKIESTWIQNPHSNLDFEFCRKVEIKNYSGPQFDASCWNQSLTFTKRPYAFHPKICHLHQCLSQYRFSDGVGDCSDGSDEIRENFTENLCQNIQKYRLSCSLEEPYCMATSSIGIYASCSDGYDRYVFGSDQELKDILCTNRNDPNCQFLRDYIQNSSIRNTTLNVRPIPMTSYIPFRSYCDSFWNSPSHFDEKSEYCQEWICQRAEYQCRTGQCIPFDWLCDGEWDCSDASDEEALLSITEFSKHNQQLNQLSNRIRNCYVKYQNQSFSKICNTSSELPCFLSNVSNPLNINESRPCIPFKQIGDGHQDCFAGHDEKNTFVDCNGFMLGFTLRDKNGTCRVHQYACFGPYNYPPDRTLCFYRSENRSCSNEKDVVCLNGSCILNARCNGELECLYGEDEYRCSSTSLDTVNPTYRWRKALFKQQQLQQIQSNIYPSSVMTTAPLQQPQRMMTNEENAFICNRGVAVEMIEGEKICFCPSAYYGKYCEFYNDRITIITHLNLTKEFDHLMFKIIVTLHFGEYIVGNHQFIVNGELEHENYVKHRFTFLYSRLPSFLLHKRRRYFVRPIILEQHPYSIHFDLFQLNFNETIQVGQWIYPIYFDYLPSFRLSKILTFPHWFTNKTLHPCINQTCPSNSICLPIFNQPGKFSCSCVNGFYGVDCQSYGPQCSFHCSSNSLCKPDFRGFFSNVDHPFCVCPLGYFGPRCYLRHEECHSHPCLNNGTCYLTYDPTGEKPFRCQCEKQFYGDRCELRKSFIRIDLNMTDKSMITVIQFCDIFSRSLQILVQDQQLIHGLPSTISYNHRSTRTPILGILKTYDDLAYLKYFIIYLLSNITQTYIISIPKQCPHVITLFNHSEFIDEDGIPMVFKYHRICRKYKYLNCFYNSDYLCVCEPDHDRSDCFLHDLNIDQCNICFYGGKCLRGDLKDSKDFFCICRRCYQGDRCQFSMEPFGSTIDSLLSSNSFFIQLTYLLLSTLLVLVGLCNNICSFVTFQRPKPRQLAVGYFLLIITLLNKFSLIFLFLKFVYNLFETSGWLNNDRLNLILCKILSYLLSISTRSSYWLASWITINRLLLVLFPTKILFKRPSIGKKISLMTIVIIGLMHIHEIIYYTIISQSNSTVCVTHYESTLIDNYNRVTTFIHYLIPVSIQIISITLLIVRVAQSGARTKKNAMIFRLFLTKQLIASKELYINPLAIALSALPQITVLFSVACQSLLQWQKHLLLCTYLFSYIPQILAFCLHVLPSSAYKKEFSQTWIAQKLFS
jgi:hypothetical protein